MSVGPDANEVLRSHGEQAVRNGFDGARTFVVDDELNDNAKSPPRLSFTLFRDIDPEPQKSWLIKDFLGAGEMSCLFGPPGSCKSTLAGDIAGHVAAGIVWHGRRVEKSGVLYVAAERAGLVKRRLAALRKHHELQDIPLAIVSGPADLRSSQEDAEQIIAFADKLTAIYKISVGLIVMETVSRLLAGGDENSSKDMGQFVRMISAVQNRTGAHVMSVHHIPADGTPRLRGHGSLLGAADTTIRIEKLGAGGLATIDKVNDGPEGENVAFRLHTIDLSHNPTTDITTTAPVVVPSDVPVREPASPKLTRNQITMLALLRAAGPGGLSQEAWNEQAREAGIGTRRKADLFDVREALRTKRLIYKGRNGWCVKD